jgi:aryl-alcohol dehydrogenase-like predicted oxidoreductase
MAVPAPEQPAAAAGSLALGGTDVVNRIGLGARWLDYRGPEAGRTLLRRALELGVNMIDTADVYGADHASERLIAEALHPYPAGLVIATKGGQVVRDGQPAPDGRPEHLRAACEASLRRLRLDTIPLYQLHQPDPGVPLEESLGALTTLQTEGKVRHIGVSNLFRGDLDRAIEVAPIASVQNLYNVGARASDPEVDTCARNGIAYLPWRPVFEGANPGGELERIAAERGATPAQVAIAWLLARSEVMLPIPGTSSLEHLEENVAAAGLALADEEIARLEAYSSE